MPILRTTRQYADGEVYTKAAVDAPLDDIEIFFNNIKINDDNLQNNGITGALKLVNQSVPENKLASNSVSSMKIRDNSVSNPKILNNAVTSLKINNESVTTSKFELRSVDTAQIEDINITKDKIPNQAITSDKLSYDSDDEKDELRAVTTDHIRNDAVTTSKLADAAVTPVKQNKYFLNHTFSLVNNQLTDPAIISVSGSRPVKLQLYAGVLILNPPNVTTLFFIDYSSNGTDWTTIYSLGGTRIDAPVFTGLRDIYLGRTTTPQVVNLQSSAGTIVTIHDTPSPGEAFYRLRGNRAIFGLSGSIPLKIFIEEL